MKLESINIRECYRHEKCKGYHGEITFEGSLGKVQINCDDTLSRRILTVCAEEIVAASRQVSEELTANIIDLVEEPVAIEPPAAAPEVS